MASSAVTWQTRWSFFSPLLIVISTIIQATIFFLIFKTLFPQIWTHQINAGFWSNLRVFFGVALFQSVLEFITHRYFMHFATVSWLIKFMNVSHGQHHGLTPISVSNCDNAGTTKRIYSCYTISQEKQHHAIAFVSFPFLAAVLVGYSIMIFLPLQLMFPTVPFFLAGGLSVATWVPLYKILHPLEHKSEEWWEKRRRIPILSFLHRVHQYHHINTRCNMAIVGFFGIPLIDWLLGTLKVLPKIIRDGDIIAAEWLKPPAPCRIIRKLDVWAKTRSTRLLREYGKKQLAR